MKFIHAADIHLDSPMRGLARYEGAPVEQMQGATRRAFINMVDFACNESVDFILLAGDLYDVDWKDYNTGLFFNQQMSRLREANIPVFMVLGNHDAGNSITRQLRLPDNVTELSYRHPETKRLENLGVAIHGQSFASKSITEDISAAYPNALQGYFNIGLLHTALNGRQGHAKYAPCTMPGLLSHGYDYWALGHVHNREILHENPWVVFPGNLQGRHARETGAKGCTLVRVENGQTIATHLPMDVLRWEVCQLNVSDVSCADEVIDKARWAATQSLQQADGRPLALRFIVQGSSPVHNELHSHSERWINEIRAAATDAGLDNIWVEKISLQTHALQTNNLQDEGPLAELGNFLNALLQDGDGLQALSAEFRSLKNALPTEARQSGRGSDVDPDNLDTIRQLLNGVEELLLSRLLVQE
ncbi:DNA repair exonuclease [Candidatus Parabeggiatoa sp. HSG14]|uniref:metallophosphoesterase family protein n=1 Tax=Candidatus Parabeggiatoa sp. HSG14 TaxID=3055593 RepID=UPI0025A88EE5|nr:DNA repair exonuclease [Thiotrichales bacterium HSG14]